MRFLSTSQLLVLLGLSVLQVVPSVTEKQSETIEYAVKYEVFYGIYIVVLLSACLLKHVVLRDTQSWKHTPLIH